MPALKPATIGQKFLTDCGQNRPLTTVKTIGKHINNALKEELDTQEVVAKIATTTKHGAIEDKTQTHMVEHYNLDVIIF